MSKNKKNLDLMVSVRHELKRNEITGHALLYLQKFIESLSHKPLSEANLRCGRHNKKKVDVIDEITHVPLKDLIKVYQRVPTLYDISPFLLKFCEIIDNDKVKIEDVSKFDELMYISRGK